MAEPGLTDGLEKWREELRREIAEGGGLTPCPFCKLPRCKRTDYIRCAKCGVNWLDEEMHIPNYLNMDPRVARMVPKVSQSAAPTVAGAERTGEK